MIEGNKIRFGYGDITVLGDPVSSIIEIKQIKPPVNVGTDINFIRDSIEYVGDPIRIKLDLDSYTTFSNRLCLVENQYKLSFEFNEYIFDFSKFNLDSIAVLKDMAKLAISNYIRLMAI